MSFTLLYVPAPLLESRAFLADLAQHYPALRGPSLLVHAPLDDNPGRTELITKKLSAQLSEAMVTSMALSAHRRSWVSLGAGLQVNPAVPAHIWATAQTIVTNTVLPGADGKLVHAPVAELLAALHTQLQPARTVLFPLNPRSGLVAQATHLTAATLPQMQEAYPEESATLELALALLPCWVAAPTQLAELA